MKMRPTRLGWAMACWFLVIGHASAAPSVADLLAIKPKIDGVAISTPTADEIKDCQVRDLLDGAKKIGFELIDGRGQTLRRFFAAKDSPKMNVWSYFRDGVEVFRQIDSNFDGKVDQYRWLGTGGMKWGIDQDQDGKIDSWYVISAEEVAQEAFAALATNDFARLRALYISPAEIKALGIPDAAAAQMAQARQTAQQKFQELLAKKTNLAGATFVHVESSTPGCWLADQVGTPKDLIKHASLSVLFETAGKKHDIDQTGEIIQVGATWRLVDVAVADVVPEGPRTPQANDNPKLTKLFADLSNLEKDITDKQSQQANPGQPSPVLAGLFAQRAKLSEAIVAESPEKELWYKQILDSLASAIIAGHDESKARLAAYREQLVTKMPGSALAAYAVYRELWSLHAVNPQPTAKSQEAYHEALAKFVKDYPRADDTADALGALGLHCEFAGAKDKEAEAANWYAQIHANFPKHHLAEWAKGAERRIKLAGNPLELSGTLLGNNQAFDINLVKGKIAIVYYWASNCKDCVADFARLKQTISTQKDVVVVCVNLDAKAANALAFLQANPLQAYHLSQPDDNAGLRGPLATAYGINVLPTVFLVGRDGRVINPRQSIAELDEAIKKAAQ